MHILLINENPVVSRLMSLCTREDSKVLEEVSNITSIQKTFYDIVFIDEDAYKGEVLEMNQHMTSHKKVLFSKEDVQINMFDFTIKKPFLPSQIIEILETPIVESIQGNLEEDKAKSFIFPLSSEEEDESLQPQVLDANEIDKIKILLDMEENSQDDVSIETLTDEEIEARKIEVIKEQLVSEGLEIVEEEDIMDVIGAKDEVEIFKILEEKPGISSVAAKQKKQKLTKKERKKIKEAISTAISGLKKKKRKKLLKGKKVKFTIQLEDRK